MAKIVLYPDERLKNKCEDCIVGDKSLIKLAKQMANAMYENFGVGLAAPQIGENRRIIVVDVGYDVNDKKSRDPLVLVNPNVIETSGEPIEAGEGCLSCPGVNVGISRCPNVKVEFYDLDGEKWEIEGDGLLARCLQHEIDHLDGITLFERASGDVRLKALKAYAEAKQAGLKPGDTSIAVS